MICTQNTAHFVIFVIERELKEKTGKKAER